MRLDAACLERMKLIGVKNKARKLLNLAFFIDNVFTYNRVEFFNFHLFRHVFFVFGGGIEVACAFA